MSTPNLKTIRGIDLKMLKAKQDAYEQSFLCIPTTDPWVPIKFLDRNTHAEVEYRLEFSYFAATQVQRTYNKSVFNGEISPDDLSDMEFLVGLLVIGLQTHHEGIGLEQVAPLVKLKHRMYYIHCIQKALEVTQPDYESMSELIGDLQDIASELEVGDTSAPLPEIVDSPIFGEPAE